MGEITAADIEQRMKELERDAEKSGYHLNPDDSTSRDLVQGLLVNEQRYGYPSCPCRLAAENEEEDLDIICPCDYRDPDVEQYGACYCSLYVSGTVLKGDQTVSCIPERRPPREQRLQFRPSAAGGSAGGILSKPVWRCRVCGYLCGRDEPPESCPICKASRKRFERFM